MLFLLAMESLHRLFKKSQLEGLLHQLSPRCDTFRVSLYSDDATVFINPSINDLDITISILSIFLDASGLKTNLERPNSTLLDVSRPIWTFYLRITL
jgi:hypothetical protein